MKVWPFLFSRNLTRDYSAVTIPDFIKEKGAAYEIYRACDRFEHAAGEAIYYKGYHPAVGDLDMVFRVVQGTERMLGHDCDAVLLDPAKRPVRLYEGFVLTDRLPDEQLHFTGNQLDKAHRAVEADFRTFTASNIEPNSRRSQTWSYLTSEGMELPAAAGEKLRLQLRDSPDLPPKAKGLPKTAAPQVGEDLPKARPQVTPKGIPESNLAASVKSQKPNCNKTVIFCLVTSVAIGAFLVYRHFRKPKPQQGSFEQRIKQEQPSVPGPRL